MFTRLKYSFLLILILFIVIAGCGSTGSGDDSSKLPPDEYEAEPFKTTKILEEGSLSTLSKIDDDGTLHFEGIPAELQGVAVNDVIVSGPGDSTDGFIRMVTGVQTDSKGLALKTVPVPIQLAFRKLHLKFTRKIENIADLGIAPAPRVKIGKRC